MSPRLPVRQLAYFVADVREAAQRHHALFGSGPFLVADHIATPAARYRGVPAALDHSAAYGQWGTVMVEFVQQNTLGPSVFRDMYPEGSGREGLHHVALFVEDLHAEIARWETAGHACALYAEMASGFPFAMIDTVARYGHMVELYSPDASLTAFYAHVARIAGDGGDLLRAISFD